MPKFYTNIDLNKNQLKNSAAHNVDGSTEPVPSSPSVGQIYFDVNGANTATANRLLVRNIANTKWLSIPYGASSDGTVTGSIVNNDISTSAAITVNKLDTTSVRLNTIGAPVASVSFNSQPITDVTTITTSGNVNVGGDLNVTGAVNQTTVNDLNVKDLTITVADGAANKTAADTAGLTVDLGSDGTAKFYYTSASNGFNFDKSVNLLTGLTYKINGTDVLSSTQLFGKTPGGAAGGDITVNNTSQDLTNKTYNGLNVSTTTGTLTLANGSTLATSGANPLTFTTTGTTSVTLPTSGTLATVPTGTNQSLPTKYTTTVTFDTLSKTITHNLGNKDVIVQLYDSSDDQVFFDVRTISNTQVTITNGTADNATYRVVVVG